MIYLAGSFMIFMSVRVFTSLTEALKEKKNKSHLMKFKS